MQFPREPLLHFNNNYTIISFVTEYEGKNDGCVAGKRYFQCEAKRGIFSRLTRLTLAPLPGAQTPTSPLSKMSPDRSRTVSPTASIRSSFQRSPGSKLCDGKKRDLKVYDSIGK